MNHPVTTQDLFEIIGRQTVDIELLKWQIEQLQAMVQQFQQASATQGIVAEGVGEY